MAVQALQPNLYPTSEAEKERRRSPATEMKSEHNVSSDTARRMGATERAKRQFRVMAVEKAVVPEGGSGNTWYSYVIENGSSSITGCRCGSREQVVEHARQYAEELNARTAGRGVSTWSPRRKK